MKLHVLALAALFITPALAQSTTPPPDKAVANLLDHLVNAPGPAGWNVWNAQGTLRDDASVSGGKAMRIVTTKGTNPWDGAASSSIIKSVQKNDALLVAFWARVEKPAPGGISTLPVGVSLAKAPYTSQFGDQVTLTSNWAMYYASGRVDNDYGPGALNFSIQLAGAAQTIDLGPVLIVDFGPNRDPATLPHNKPVAAAPAPAPAAAPASSAYDTELAKLRAKLPAKGTLISDPAQGIFGFGPDQTNQPIAAPDVAGGKAVRFTAKKGDNPWSDGASLPVNGAIKKGDTVLLAVYVRAVDVPAGSKTGEISEFGVHMANAPWTALATGRATRPRGEWKLIYTSGTAAADYPAGSVNVGIQLGCCSQTIDIGPAFVLNLGANVPAPVLLPGN